MEMDEIEELIKKLPTMTLEEMLQMYREDRAKAQIADLRKDRVDKLQVMKNQAYSTGVVADKMAYLLKVLNGEEEPDGTQTKNRR